MLPVVGYHIRLLGIYEVFLNIRGENGLSNSETRRLEIKPVESEREEQGPADRAHFCVADRGNQGPDASSGDCLNVIKVDCALVRQTVLLGQNNLRGDVAHS